MKMRRRNYFLLISLLLTLLLILTACGNESSESESDNNETGEGEESKEVTIDSEMGDVTIPVGAERVLAPYHEDALLSLGVTPIAKWSIGKSLQDYLEPQLKDIPKIEWTLPLEQTLSLNPDLIILENNLDSYEGSYEDYKKIAPTYVMTEETTNNWQQQIDTFGQLLGMEKKAEQTLAGYEERVAEVNSQLEEAIGDETVAAIWVTGGKFFLFEKNRHSAELIYSKLGVNTPSLVEELGKATTQWEPISLEKLSELNADHVFLLAAEGESGIETLNNSAVWQNTPAAQNDNIYILEDASNWTNTGLKASEKTMDKLLNYLVE